MLLDSPAELQVETISTDAGLARLHCAWRELWTAVPDASPFQSPEWLMPWWRHFGGEGLRTLAAWRERRLVGLAPLFLYEHAGGSCRQLTLLGNGISDRLDVLVHPDAEAAALDALGGAIGAMEDWNLCDFRDLAAGSPLLRLAAPPGVATHLDPDEPSPTLRLPGSPERLDEAIPPTFLKKLRYAGRRAEREGEVRVEAATPETAEEALDELFRLHGARWSERGEDGVLQDGRVEAFHREVAPAFAREGMLRLYTLHLAGRAAAVLYAFHSHRRTCYYLGGFDPGLKILSSGNLILLHAVESAIREGAAEFDFLRGREAYKYDWGAADAPHQRLRWRRCGPAG